MPEAHWPFEDPPNVAVITTPAVIEEGRAVLAVWHDEDGNWIFQSDETEYEAKIISLAYMLKLQPDLVQLADLPRGWAAWRQSPKRPWIRQDDRPLYTLDSATVTNEEFPVTFRIPTESQRRSVAVGDLVKLMFRLRTRETSVVERMWVEVGEILPDWRYTGSLANDSYTNPEVCCGMPVEFTADDIIDIQPQA